MDYALPSWADDRIPCALCNRLTPANHLANAPIHGGGICEDCCVAECEADADEDLDFYNARNYKAAPSSQTEEVL
jgi:hypothetical protein